MLGGVGGVDENPLRHAAVARQVGGGDVVFAREVLGDAQGAGPAGGVLRADVGELGGRGVPEEVGGCGGCGGHFGVLVGSVEGGGLRCVGELSVYGLWGDEEVGR